MIHTHHPDIPNRDTGLKFIGYWDGNRNPKRLGGFEPETKFELPNPLSFMDAAWAPAEREVVAAYLRNGQPWENWFGPSWCRFGCEDEREEMGYSDMTDGVYVWPEGYVHYVERHWVKPPQEFIDHVYRR
jgi:hypothetical protein